jgi:hypothetical protein
MKLFKSLGYDFGGGTMKQKSWKEKKKKGRV